MAEEQVATASAPAAAPSKKGKVATTKQPKTTKSKVVDSAASHPSSAKMVLEAVTKLEEKGGSSLQAIKKYISEVHKADVVKLNAHIKKAVKKLVDEGKLAQTTGKGAAGSFKLAPKTEKKVIKEKKPAAKKVTTAKVEKTAVKPKKVAPAAPKAKPKKKEVAKAPTTVAEKKGKKLAAPKAPKTKTISKSSSGAVKGQKKVAPKKK